MLIESLFLPDGHLTVGIAEIKNSKVPRTDELIEIAQTPYKGVIAVQLLNADLVSGVGHLLSAAQNAVNAWKGKYMVSRSLDIEILVYSSAQRQISRAINIMGVQDGLETVAVVAVGENKEDVRACVELIQEKIGEETEPMFAPSEERLERVAKEFHVTKQEIQSITSSDDLDSRMDALTGCIASRVTIVAFDN